MIMDFDNMIHHFTLHRSGWVPHALPWPDNQLWARTQTRVSDKNHTDISMQPMFGPSNLGLLIRMAPVEKAQEVGWVSTRVSVVMGHGDSVINHLPLSWYVGSVSDWPTGLVRGAEVFGMVPPSNAVNRREQALWALSNSYPRGVWTLSVRREY